MKEWLILALIITLCALPLAALISMCIYYEVRRARLIKLGRPLEDHLPPGFEVVKRDGAK